MVAIINVADLKLKQIARETGYSINTVRKYARDNTKPVYSDRPIKTWSRLESFLQKVLTKNLKLFNSATSI